MKTCLLFLTLALSCLTLQSATKKNSDYSIYFEGILRAEHKLANGELVAALREYNAVFRQFDFVFARDAYNALQLAVITKQQYTQRDKLLLLCANAGVPEHVLRQNALIQTAYAFDDNLFRSVLSKGTAAYMQRIDTALRAEMQLRYEMEQGSKGQSNYREICTDNFNRILELCKQGRFPGEQVIGVDDELKYGHAIPTLLHYPNAYVQLQDYLWTTLHKGQIQPLTLTYIYDFNQTRQSVLYTSQVPTEAQYFGACYNSGFGLESTNQLEVDSARKKVWLRPQAEKYKILAVAKAQGMDFREGW